MQYRGARGLGGVRVSVMRDDDVDKVSPEQQRESWTSWAEDHGIAIVGDFEDLDVSASIEPAKRPGFGPWITDRVDEWDVLLVTKNDRLFRSTYDFVVFAKWLEHNKKAMVYVEQNLDLDFRANANPIQMAANKMFMLMATIFAEIELENIKDRFRKTHKFLRSTNRWPGGKPPYGYVTVDHPEGGRMLQLDAETSGVVRRMAEMLLTGMSYNEVADILTADGILTPRKRANPKAKTDGAWNPVSVYEILKSPTAMGLKTTRSETNRKDHVILRDDLGLPIQMADPIFTDDEWTELQAEIDRRATRRNVERSKNSSALLGVAYCGGCGGRLYLSKGRWPLYRCRKVKNKPACSMHHFREPELHEIMDLCMAQDLADVPLTKRVYVKGSDASVALESVEKIIGQVRKEYDAGFYEGEEDSYFERISKLMERKRELKAQPQNPSRWEDVPTGETYAEAYARMTLEERRQLLLRANIKLTCKPGDITLQVPPDLKSLLPSLRIVSA